MLKKSNLCAYHSWCDGKGHTHRVTNKNASDGLEKSGALKVNNFIIKQLHDESYVYRTVHHCDS